MRVALAQAPTTLTSAYLPLFRELGDLKRITSDQTGSIATRLFASAWGALIAGIEPQRVMAVTVARALASARLGDLDAEKLGELGLTADEGRAVLERSFDEVSAALDPTLAATLRAALGEQLPEGGAPAFVAVLARQPRAGATCPGRPRIMLAPAENHAEHSLVVALYGVIAAPVYDADPAQVFVAGLAHHLHSAAMPDSGFTGEILLGDLLDRVIATARAQAMATLPVALASTIEAAIAPLAGDATPEARAFHAADVIDRVLEIEYHLRRPAMTDILDTYGLVHAGPVKPFHDRVLTEVGLP